MKTAVIISGEARTFKACWPTQYWQVYRHLEDVHFFVHVAADDQANDMTLIWKHFPVSSARIAVDNPPVDLWAPPANAAFGAPYFVHPDLGRIIRQWWHWREAWRMLQQSDQVFDRVIRMRPDNYFQAKVEPREPLARSGFFPWWGRWGGENDRFAILGIEATLAYSLLFENVGELLNQGCPLHPETMLAAQLEHHEIGIQHADFEFATQRMDGTRREPEYTPRELALRAWEA